MNTLEKVHSGYVYGRRVITLVKALESLVLENAMILDMGCGDGLIACELTQRREDIKIYGADVLLRSRTFIPAVSFDGSQLPFRSEEFDMVMLIDVLHHTQDVSNILMEATRITKKYLVIKDHLSDRILAKPTLRFMDIVGNVRYGVKLPFNYLSKKEWLDLFQKSDLKIEQWNEDLALYPWWADWLFGKSLHFLASLQKKKNKNSPQAPIY